ncbi:hypothetical protein QE152_g13337 [Popillia japonica]|uniref:Uncharacterized protein n=1 Tax=Popillia japonica TaxID=7064 RepID=A0AAW1LAC9_POPJA
MNAESPSHRKYESTYLGRQGVPNSFSDAPYTTTNGSSNQYLGRQGVPNSFSDAPYTTTNGSSNHDAPYTTTNGSSNHRRDLSHGVTSTFGDPEERSRPWGLQIDVWISNYFEGIRV